MGGTPSTPLYYGRGRNWDNLLSLLNTVSINTPNRLKLNVRHCWLLTSLNYNFGSAQIDDEDAEILELSSSLPSCVNGAWDQETITHPTPAQAYSVVARPQATPLVSVESSFRRNCICSHYYYWKTCGDYKLAPDLAGLFVDLIRPEI